MHSEPVSYMGLFCVSLFCVRRIGLFYLIENCSANPIIFTSHDKVFVDRIATKQLYLGDGKIREVVNVTD